MTIALHPPHGAPLRSLRERLRPSLAVIGVAASVLLICNLPRLVLLLLGPPGRVFMGPIWGSHDAEVYFQTIGDGAMGAWLWADRLDGAAHGAYLIYPVFILAGRLTAGLGLSPEAVYEACRWVTEPLALVAAWIYVRASLPEPGRLLGYALALLGGGLGWLFIAHPDTPIGTATPIDLSDPVFNVLNSFQMAPHLALSVAGMAIYGWGLLRASEGGWRGLWGAPALAVVTSYHEFMSPTALLYGALFVIWKGRNWTALAMLGVSAALSAPFDLYLLWLKLFDPLASHWVTGGNWEIENLPSLLVGRAVLLPFALLGIVRTLRAGARGPALAACWIAVALLFNAAPLFRDSALHRSLEGASLAWGVLSAYGLFELGSRVRLYATTVALLTAVLQAPLIVVANSGNQALYWNRDEYRAMAWLRHEGARGGVVASPATARRVIALTGLRNDPDGGADRTEWVPDQLLSLGAVNRSDWLRGRGDTVVFWGEAEQSRYGAAPPAGLRRLHQEGSVYVLGP